MTDESRDRKLVTFALLGYNQEHYIREAIEGAFAQTYEPLEIILSDDCSSDRTFEIMQELAEGYEGPHDVRVVKTPRNLGVTAHVLLRGREASGEVVVLAAGDDVSKPQRTEEHIRRYRDNDVMAASSAFDLVDDAGALISKHNMQPIGKHASESQRSLFETLEFPYVVIQGSTASYRRCVFHLSLPESDFSFAEDNLFNFLIYAHGYRVAFIEQSLVMYRSHRRAISNRPPFREDIRGMEARFHEGISKELGMLDVFEWIARDVGDRCTADLAEIRRRKARFTELREWPHLRLRERMMSIFASVTRLDLRSLTWKCLRVVGDTSTYQPRSLIYRIVKR